MIRELEPERLEKALVTAYQEGVLDLTIAELKATFDAAEIVALQEIRKLEGSEDAETLRRLRDELYPLFLKSRRGAKEVDRILDRWAAEGAPYAARAASTKISGP